MCCPTRKAPQYRRARRTFIKRNISGRGRRWHFSGRQRRRTVLTSSSCSVSSVAGPHGDREPRGVVSHKNCWAIWLLPGFWQPAWRRQEVCSDHPHLTPHTDLRWLCSLPAAWEKLNGAQRRYFVMEIRFLICDNCINSFRNKIIILLMQFHKSGCKAEKMSRDMKFIWCLIVTNESVDS